MKKMAAMFFAIATGTALFCTAAFAQDAPGSNMITVSGVNLSDLHLSGDLTVAAPGLNLQVGAAVKDDLLAGTEKFAQGASKVTEINLNPSTMSMVGRTYGPEGDATKKMKLMVVHDYSYDKPGMYRMEDVEAYVKKLQDGSWNCPIISRDKDKMSYICAKTDSDQTNEMVILDAAPQKLTFVHMAGAVSLNDLTHMSDSAHSLSRQVGPHGNQFMIFQQDMQQRDGQHMAGKVVIVPPTPPVPPSPAAPAQ